MAKSDIKLKIKSWRECPIDTYYKIVEVIEDEAISNGERDIKLISILCGVDEDKIWDMNITDVRQLISDMNWLNDFEFDRQAKYKKLVLDEKLYVIEPDLQKFTAAQYIDFQTLWAKKDLKTYFGNILACFIIPKGKKYGEGYDVQALANSIRRELDIITANEILFFSQNKFLNLIKAIRTYLKLNLIKNQRKLDKEGKIRLERYTQMKWNNILDGLVVWT